MKEIKQKSNEMKEIKQKSNEMKEIKQKSNVIQEYYGIKQKTKINNIQEIFQATLNVIADETTT